MRTILAGGYGHYRIEQEPLAMRVPDLMLKSVGFLAEVSGGNAFDVVATGFFVSMPAKDASVGGVFLSFITAKHVAEALRERPFVILVNKVGGGVMAVPSEVLDNTWWIHQTEKRADV